MQDYKDFLSKGERLLQEGRISELRDHIETGAWELKAKAVTRTVEPYTIERLREDLATTVPGLETGYRTLDEFVRIPQEALSIIAGRPSHGKTTLLMNLFLNVIKKYPERHFFFFSYQESVKKLAVKLITILSGAVIDERFNVTQIGNYISENSTSNERINEGIGKYRDVTEAKRLNLIDEHFYIDDLTDTIAHLSVHHPVGAIFIDYIQKVKTRGRYNTRELEIQDISRQLLEAALGLKIPIVVGAQFNRLVGSKKQVIEGTLREAGDIEQDANLVLGLWNETKNKEDEERERIERRGTSHDKVVDLDLLILKNRDGESNRTVTVTFNRPTLTITDKA